MHARVSSQITCSQQNQNVSDESSVLCLLCYVGRSVWYRECFVMWEGQSGTESALLCGKVRLVQRVLCYVGRSVWYRECKAGNNDDSGFPKGEKVL